MRCIIVDKDKKTRTILEQFVRQTTAFELLKSCEKIEDAISILLNKEVEVVFIDISMSGMDEVEFMKSVNHNNTQLIVIANTEKYAKEAFDFDVVDYLMRPITWDRFLKSIAKARRLIASTQIQNKGDDILFIKESGRLIKIHLDDILYLESVGDYVAIKTVEKKFVVHTTLKSIETKIDGSFMRVHQSYIVNITKVKAIEDGSLAIDDKFIPIGRTYKKELMQRLKLL